MKFSIIYVYYNTPHEIVTSIQSVMHSIGIDSFEVIIVDNASPKKIPKEFLKNKHIRMIYSQKNIGYGGGLNLGAKKAKGEILLFVNPDTIFSQSAIARMIKKMKYDKNIGIIGPQLLDTQNKSLQNVSRMPFLPQSLVVFSFLRKVWPFRSVYYWYNLAGLDQTKEYKVDVVSGACMMIRSKTFIEAGKFDEQFFMYFEEADLCFRVKKLDLKIVYLPTAKVVHLVGKSLSDKNKIQNIFEKSRFYFLRKYHGVIPALFAEIFFRVTTAHNVLLISIIGVSLFLNLYQIQSNMMFFGDFAHDFFAARDMLITHNAPLVGITSSVTWLHQGPLSIYFIGLAFLLSNFHPVAPAILYAGMGVVSTALVYVLGKLFFSKQVGLVSALFYATSPLIVVNARIPYHTAPIPFFSCLFFLLLLYLIKNMNRKCLYFFTFLIMGFLLQLELSNAVVLLVAFLCFKFFKIKLTKTRFFLSLSGLVIGIIPFILYDLTHQFKQTVGFPLWIVNRSRLFLGLTLSTNATTGEIPGAISTVFAQISRTIFPAFLPITIFLIVGILLTMIIRRKFLFTRQNKGFIITILWLSIPLLSFLVHAAPGTAYFPLIFPPIALLVGYCLSLFTKKSVRIGILVLVVLVCIYNGYYTITNQYFLNTGTFHGSTARGWNYGFGPAFSEQEKIAQFIVKDASGQKFSLIGGGSMTRFSSSIDNYKYLVWWMGGKLDTYAKLAYTLFPSGEKNVGKAYYSNEFIFIKKN